MVCVWGGDVSTNYDDDFLSEVLELPSTDRTPCYAIIYLTLYYGSLLDQISGPKVYAAVNLYKFMCQLYANLSINILNIFCIFT